MYRLQRSTILSENTGTSIVAGADLASWIYRELKAMEKLAHMLERNKDKYYHDKAENLKDFVQKNYFDYCDGFFL